LAVIIETSVLC